MKNKLIFSALNPYLQDNIVKPTESVIRGQEYVSWGDNNQYPMYINGLYESVPTLQTLINGTADYVCGNDTASKLTIPQPKLKSIIRAMALQYTLYGGFYVNVLRNKLGQVADIVVLDARKVRTNDDNTVFWYSNDFANNKSYGRIKAYRLPRFDSEANDPSSIYYTKSDAFKVYPKPIYASAVVACEIERQIDKYQLNNIENSLASNVIINFNNGVPTDEMKEEIERNLNDKFAGADNAGRFMVSFNESKETEVTVTPIAVDNFNDKYNAIAQRSRQQIFTSFRANPNLFGINTENNGFSQENFKDAFELFNTTVVMPIQNTITTAVSDIFGVEDAVTIEPFAIKFQ